jgi:hypothetical protein
MRTRFKQFMVALILGSVLSSQAQAGGFLADFVSTVIPLPPVRDLAKALDDENRRAKEHNPVWKAIDEGVSRPFRETAKYAAKHPDKVIWFVVIVGTTVLVCSATGGGCTAAVGVVNTPVTFKP